MKQIILHLTASFLLLLGFFGLNNLSPRQALADALCGDGYVCWDSNGGTAVMVQNCYDDLGYCAVNNTEGQGTYSEYCNCDGSADCSCTVGPGTACEEVAAGETFYECFEGSEDGQPCTQGPYGDCPGGSCVPSSSPESTCKPNNEYSTIGCCYGTGVTPTPTPSPSGGGGGGGETYTFTGNIYNDPNALPGGIGGTDNLCTGSTATLIASGGVIGLSRPGENKAQLLAGASFSITANTNNSDYTVALDLPFPPADPDNPWQCACNSDPTDPYRCIYTNQQPNQGLTNFFITQAGSTSNAWFQTLGGSSWASNNIQSKIPFATCSLPTCNPAFILRDPLGTLDSAGFPLTNSGAVVTSESGGVYIHEADGRSVAQQAQALGVEVPLENYSHFYSKFGGSAQTLTGVGKPIVGNDTLGVFLYSGNLSIDETNPWYTTNEEQIIVFVNGNLTIDDTTGGENRIISVATGGDAFLMFIVSGNITVSSSVGYSNIYTSASAPDVANVEGVFVADGILTIEGLDNTIDKKFIGAGTFVGWSGVDLQRSFDDGVNPNLNNNAAAEAFIFRPDFIINAPRKIKSAQQTWREIAPSF
jgi:hypothetical protein